MMKAYNLRIVLKGSDLFPVFEKMRKSFLQLSSLVEQVVCCHEAPPKNVISLQAEGFFGQVRDFKEMKKPQLRIGAKKTCRIKQKERSYHASYT